MKRKTGESESEAEGILPGPKAHSDLTSTDSKGGPHYSESSLAEAAEIIWGDWAATVIAWFALMSLRGGNASECQFWLELLSQLNPALSEADLEDLITEAHQPSH